jgi:5-methylcytosine-specific restriction endonuclease McrA
MFPKAATNRDGRLGICKKCKVGNQSAENERLLNRVTGYYSDGKCACCGTRRELSIDHINPRRRGDRLLGRNLWRSLERDNFPPGFQVLCMPCNISKRDGEKCKLVHVRDGIYFSINKRTGYSLTACIRGLTEAQLRELLHDALALAA